MREVEPPRISTIEAPYPDAIESFDGSLRIASWNIRLGLRDDGSENFTTTGPNSGLQTVADVLRFIDADVVCLQEVSIRAAQFILRDLGRYHGVLDLRNTPRGFRGIVSELEPEIGTLTLIGSDLAAIDDLGTTRSPLSRPTERGQYRSSQSVTIPNVSTIVNTHLSPTTMAENRTQASETAELIEQTKADIVCGDLNVIPAAQAAQTIFKTMEDHTDCGSTFKSRKTEENKTFDYIAWRNFIGINCLVTDPPEAARMSDHSPVVIDLLTVDI